MEINIITSQGIKKSQFEINLLSRLRKRNEDNEYKINILYKNPFIGWFATDKWTESSIKTFIQSKPNTLLFETGIELIKGENDLLSKAKNRALLKIMLDANISKGNTITLLDSDNFFNNETLHLLVKNGFTVIRVSDDISKDKLEGIISVSDVIIRTSIQTLDKDIKWSPKAHILNITKSDIYIDKLVESIILLSKDLQ